MGDGEFGSAGFLRVLGAITAFGLAVAVAGVVVLTVHGDRQPSNGVEFATGRGIGVVVLQTLDDPGQGPFTNPIAVDLAVDPLLIALPPLSAGALESPHRRHSLADELAAGDFGFELVRERDASGELKVTDIRQVAERVLGTTAALDDLSDFDGDGRDDDGRFTLQASDGSAVCVTVEGSRPVAISIGLPRSDGGGAQRGYDWSPYGPCSGLATAQTGSQFRVGTSPGAYGAVERGDVCDVGTLAADLARNEQAGLAWATAAGIDVAEIPTVLETLTPVVLLRDTVVTDHGYLDGRISTRLAVLQRGTAVLIDEVGRPAVRCMSGSPLRTAPPLPSGVVVEGPAWRGFSLEEVQTVPAAIRPATTFVLVDVETGLPLTRAAGINGSLSSLAGPIVGPREGGG
ncbi:MAG: DUF6777 domain-containing protein [Acidimicrobiia bacterium]